MGSNRCEAFPSQGLFRYRQSRASQNLGDADREGPLAIAAKGATMYLTVTDFQPVPSPEIAAFKEELVALRRDFHEHPELAFEEVRTSAIVIDYLKGLGLTPRTGIAKTGVTADIVGGLPGPTILIRADMDALPIQEETGLPFASKVEGKMHACGHDGHTAILLVTAKVMMERREKLKGTIRLLFQPAEEGPGGAEPMIKEGVLEGVQAALGLHLWLHLPTGQVNFCAGPMLAATDEFDLKVTGVGTHAASPHMGADPITTLAHVMTSAQSLVTRGVDPKNPMVFSITKIQGGTAYNVIPKDAQMGGTLRTYDENLRAEFKTKFASLAKSIAAAHGCEAELTWREGYPVLVNDPEVSRICEQACQERFRLPPSHQRPDARSMGGEDMAYYLQEVPGCFLFLGAYNEDTEATYNHHHPKFTVDEDSLPMGVELFLACQEHLATHLGAA